MSTYGPVGVTGPSGITGPTGFTGPIGGTIPVVPIRPGLTYPSGDRFRLSVALTQWGLALDDGHVRTVDNREPPYAFLDSSRLHPSDTLPDGYFVLRNDPLIYVYRMQTPLEDEPVVVRLNPSEYCVLTLRGLPPGALPVYMRVDD